MDTYNGMDGVTFNKDYLCFYTLMPFYTTDA